MDDCDINDRTFKISVKKKLNKIKNKISERKLSELSDKFNEQKKYLTKETEIPKENQKEIVELKNSINEIKNAIKSNGNRANHMEERIKKLKDRNIEMIRVEEEKELRFLF